MSVFCNLGRTPWVYRAFSLPETFRGRREETDSDRAGLKRHLRVRVLYAQPRSRSLRRYLLWKQTTDKSLCCGLWENQKQDEPAHVSAADGAGSAMPGLGCGGDQARAGSVALATMSTASVPNNTSPRRARRVVFCPPAPHCSVRHAAAFRNGRNEAGCVQG